MARTLILGIGNTMLTDEGIGPYAITRLREERPLAEDVVLIDGGTLGFSLGNCLDGVDTLIVVDAAELGAAPGTVRCFVDAAMDAFLGGRRKSVHEVSLVDLLDMARLLDELPPRRALIGVQPGSLAWGVQPTATVLAAVPEVARRIGQLLAQWPAIGKPIPT